MAMEGSVVRSTLHDQCVALLHEAICSARWKDEMPSEAELVRELNVGRMTLRRALSQLAAEGWIDLGGRGCRHRVKRRAVLRAPANGKTFRVLTPYRFSELGSCNHQLLNETTERLGNSGYHLEIERHPGIFTRFDPKMAERLAALPGTAG